MNRINTTTNHGTDIWAKVSLLKDKEQADRTNLHGPGDDPDPRPEDGTVPPYPLSLRDVEVPAPREVPASGVAPRVAPQQILAHKIRNIILGIPLDRCEQSLDKEEFDNALWVLGYMTLGEARTVCQKIANEVAVTCFDEKGHVDVEKLQTWMEFFKNAENFKREPFCLIPYTELMRSQMHRVCECLLDNQNGARDLLDTAVDISVGPYGQAILDTMSKGRSRTKNNRRTKKQPLRPNEAIPLRLGKAIPLRSGEAILASLLAPHRQRSLPTCAIDSRINAEIRNHLERLIEIYIQMLSGDQFTFPSGYSISLQSIVNGFITVDLKNSEFGRNRIFRDIFSDDPDKVAQQTAEWRLAGIKYDPAKKYELRLPVRNMNDVLHAHFFWASSFGNEKIGIDTEYGTVRVYAGLDGEDRIFPLSTSVTGSDFSPGMAKLKEEAKAQQARGHSCMHVVTEASTKTIDGKDETFSHAETLDIAALLALDPDNMEIGKAYSIGDRNSAVRNPFPQNPSHDIFHLAVKKVDNTPTFEFGESQGSTFKKVNISSFWVYSVDIEEHDAEFWEQFRPQGQIP